ncbi:MAG: hypothetical protein IKD79_02240 [Oscillospiraceae bacterium]|nr:hypothetical protein [Oscillospiraceae bacterium]
MKGVPATAGSRMLESFVPPFDAEAVTRLQNAGYAVSGKSNVGEFGLDLLGETSYFGPVTGENGSLRGAAAALVADGEADFAICTDLDGAPRRAAALEGVVFLKPTYGTVSRYGVIPCACSGEQIGVMAKTAAGAAELLSVIAGHDDKDGTSLPAERYDYTAVPASGLRVGVCAELLESASPETAARVREAASALGECGDVRDGRLSLAQGAWRILLSGETCNNLSRYDGVKFGFRAQGYKTIDELYTMSRTQAFTLLTKQTILYGSDVLSKGRYDTCYDRSLRIRRILRGAADELFKQYDVLAMPACSRAAYTAEELGDSIDAVYDESRFTALASILGLPAVTVGGVQLVADSMKDGLLLSAAAAIEKAVTK